jgi:GNAT superfamily N-acetyltransferase
MPFPSVACKNRRMLELDGYSVARLGPDDAARLQPLLERCADYYLLADGAHPRADEALHEITALPPNRVAEDKFAFGVFEGEATVAYLDLLRDYPKAGEWWIGFLLIDPGQRGRGLGTSLYRAAAGYAKGEGATQILLGVLEQNPRAQRFWTAMGFIESGRARYVSPITGQESEVLVMRSAL